MSRVCILTDSTAQFTRFKFPGMDRVSVIPYDVQPGEQAGDTSVFLRRRLQSLIPPSEQEILLKFSRLAGEYDTIFVLTLSSHLHSAARIVLDRLVKISNQVTVNIIETQTTGIGLGYLVQVAASAAAEGVPVEEIERRLRTSIPHIYTILCIPQLTSLVSTGYLDTSQALVGEMMGMLPIFAIEEGRLTPVEKVRTHRHLFECFQEFINEFDSPASIILMKGSAQSVIRTHPLRSVYSGGFP